MKLWAVAVVEGEELILQGDMDVVGHMGLEEVDPITTAGVHQWVWLLVLLLV